MKLVRKFCRSNNPSIEAVPILHDELLRHCGELAPASSQTPTKTLAHSPLPWDKEKNRRKAKRLVDRDNDSLIRKAKAVCTSKAKRRIHSLLSVSRASV